MNTEHNPVAVLISQIQDKWNKEVYPFKEIKLVRWVIKPQEARLYEGFLTLESTEHGSIDEVMITMLTPFTDAKTFSKNLIIDWINQYKKEKENNEKENSASTTFNWDFSKFEKQLALKGGDYTDLLMDMFSSFQLSFDNKETRLTIALTPRTVSDIGNYSTWLDQRLTKGIPEQLLLLTFDYDDELYFDALCKKHKEQIKNLVVKIDLEGAVGKLSKMGNQNSPDAQFKNCMQKMGAALNANSLSRLNKWGKKGLEITQQTGLKDFFASAHIIYAGMLFHFEKFDEINQLLDQALTLSLAGLKAGNKTCQSLIIECYAYKGACKQHQKLEQEAAALFVKQGELAIEYNLGLQALTAWWQAYNLYHKKDNQQYIKLLEKSYLHGITLPKEELASSCIGYIAFDYYDYLVNIRQIEKSKTVDNFMQELSGANWQAAVAAYKTESKRKKRFLFI